MIKGKKESFIDILRKEKPDFKNTGNGPAKDPFPAYKTIEREVWLYLFSTSSRISIPLRTSSMFACDPMCPTLKTLPASDP